MKLYNYCWSMVQEVKGYLKDRKGQGMVEYVLVIALIAVVIIAALSPLGTAIRDRFTDVANKVTGAGI